MEVERMIRVLLGNMTPTTLEAMLGDLQDVRCDPNDAATTERVMRWMNRIATQLGTLTGDVDKTIG